MTHKDPPNKHLGCGFSTPYTLFYLICTINSELNYFPIFTNVSEWGSLSADFQWTGSIPGGFLEGFRVEGGMHWKSGENVPHESSTSYYARTHTATHCNTLQHCEALSRESLMSHQLFTGVIVSLWHTLQYTALHYNSLQHTAIMRDLNSRVPDVSPTLYWSHRGSITHTSWPLGPGVCFGTNPLCPLSSELMVQIKQKRGHGSKNHHL